MSFYGPISIVDLIANDLTSNAQLPPATTVRLYAEPVVTNPDSCPFLAVWTEITDYELLTGAEHLEAYSRRHDVVVAYCVASPMMADTGGTGDPATVAALEAIADDLDTILTTYASGIPTTSHQVIATIRSAKLEPVSGTIWRAAFTLRVEQAA